MVDAESCPATNWMRSISTKRLLDTAMAGERTAGLPRELCVLPFLNLSEDTQRPIIEVDIGPEESVAAVVTSVTNEFGSATAREREYMHERAVAYFDDRLGALLVDGVVSALVDEPK